MEEWMKDDEKMFALSRREVCYDLDCIKCYVNKSGRHTALLASEHLFPVRI